MITFDIKWVLKHCFWDMMIQTLKLNEKNFQLSIFFNVSKKKIYRACIIHQIQVFCLWKLHKMRRSKEFYNISFTIRSKIFIIAINGISYLPPKSLSKNVLTKIFIALSEFWFYKGEESFLFRINLSTFELKEVILSYNLLLISCSYKKTVYCKKVYCFNEQRKSHDI